MGKDKEPQSNNSYFKGVNFKNSIRAPSSRYATLNKLIFRDLNNVTSTPIFSLYSKDDMTTYLSNPYQYASQIRSAVTYLYGASSHFRRLVLYFSGLTNLSYVITPHKLDVTSSNPTKIRNNYQKTVNLLANLDVKNQFSQILPVCFREDTFYGTLWSSKDNITLQKLPSDYCNISTIEGNVFNVTFDFSYFDTRSEELEYFPPEFSTKYAAYQSDRQNKKWQELSAPESFAIKCNKDIPEYPLPPFIGVLREIYDLEDYKQLKLTKADLENYALLVMQLGMTTDGDYAMEYNEAKDFWGNLDSVLPEEVGSVLSPMKIDKIDFNRSGAQDVNYIAEAENSLFTSAGVSSLLFNNEKASSNALLLSIKADQAITFEVVKSIEAAINRYLQSNSFGKNFRTVFLDVSRYNQIEMAETYMLACQYGMPMVSYYCAAQGLPQTEMEAMNYLETDVMGVKEKFIPVQSANVQSGKNTGGSTGAPEKDIEELTENGEIARERDEGAVVE